MGPGGGTHSWGVLTLSLQRTAFDLSALWSLQAGFSVKKDLQAESVGPSVEVGSWDEQHLSLCVQTAGSLPQGVMSVV